MSTPTPANSGISKNSLLIKAILFDFGGVIYEHPQAIIPTVLSYIYHQPLEATVKEYRKYQEEYFTGKLKTNKLIKSLSSAFASEKTIKEVKELWLKYYGRLAKANEEMLSLVRKLKKGYQVFLFSDTTEISNFYNRQTGIYGYFDGLIFSYRTGFKKPDPRAFEAVLRMTNLSPTKCLLIDDLEENVSAAKQAGMKAIKFNVLTGSPEALIGQLEQTQVRLNYT